MERPRLRPGLVESKAASSMVKEEALFGSWNLVDSKSRGITTSWKFLTSSIAKTVVYVDERVVLLLVVAVAIVPMGMAWVVAARRPSQRNVFSFTFGHH